MENIAHFLAGADKLGVPKHDLFQTIDLYEKKNMTQVVDTIFAVSRYAYKAGTCTTVSVGFFSFDILLREKSIFILLHISSLGPNLRISVM